MGDVGPIKQAMPEPSQKFGTFLGVYTPSVLTILGLIMYLRFGWVVGNVGLPLTLLMVMMASSITFFTALSASSIATNMRVGAGGEYFLISRSLGLELGGAIGIPLYLCRTLSITFYSFGLAETGLLFWPPEWGAPPWYALQLMTACVIVVITIVSGKSAAMALKVQIPIMVAVALSVAALLAGVIGNPTHPPEWYPTYRSAPEGFWYVFAVFFPAVTGFTAGIGMSGDLKNPQRSIPKGTLFAVGTGALTYLTIPFVLSITTLVTPAQLAEPRIVWNDIALLGPWLVIPGVLGAILSSAFGSVLGGPRVLQALAQDGLAPGFLARLSKDGQPTIATWISGVIALGAVALGGLNEVAAFVSILFLTLYVTINLSAAVEKMVGNPSFRPTINVHWIISLLGAAGALAVMFLISPLACVMAGVLELALFLYLRRRSLEKEWGDVRAGFWMALARYALLNLRRHRSHARNWRPHILLFAGDVTKRIGLARLASWFNQNRGVLTVCELIVGDLKTQKLDRVARRQEMERVLEEAGLTAFGEVDVVPEFESGVISTAQAAGMGGLRSNTVMLGWPEKRERLESQLRIMRAVHRSNKSTIMARLNWAHEPGQTKNIDLWWGGKERNGDLMLLLAYLLNLNPEWNDARINVRSIAADEEEQEEMRQNLKQLLRDVRIPAVPSVIVRARHESVADVLRKTSARSDVVFLGMMEPEEGEEANYAERLTEMTRGLKTVIFVRNAGEFVGTLI